MTRKPVNILLVVFLVQILCVLGYEIPEVTIEVLKPKGFRASIPDAPGIGLFSFNGNINRAIDNQNIGEVTAEIFGPTNGRWTFVDNETTLKNGDTINYWVMVSVNRLGYIKDNLSFEYNESKSQSAGTAPIPQAVNPKPAICGRTATTVRGRPACAGEVIFEDTFEQPSNNWLFEQKIPTAYPEYPFVSYHNRAATINIVDGKLRVAPSLLQNLPPYSIETVRSGTLDLFKGCTEAVDTCSMTASGSDILPPVVAGRASTRYSFTFRYGVVEVRAKLVKGDWLYPEILLEPFLNKYGREHFASGVVKIAFSRGNKELRTGQQQIGNSKLYGGVVLDRFQCHDNLLFSKDSQQYWGDGYHTYSLSWEPERMIWSVDGIEYGRLESPATGLKEKLQNCPGVATVFRLWALGTKMAPFDEEFYLTLGLAAGGITEFPDNSVTTFGRSKPWMNLSSKAKLHFWQEVENWYATWNQSSVLEVDSVKVTAL